MKFLSEKVVPVIVILIFIGLFGMIVWVFKSYFENKNAFTAIEPITFQLGEVRPGEEIIAEVNYCLNTDQPVTVKRSIEDRPIDLSPTPVSFTQGCRTALLPYRVPIDIELGEHSATLYVTIPTVNFGDIYPTVTFRVI